MSDKPYPREIDAMKEIQGILSSYNEDEVERILCWIESVNRPKIFDGTEIMESTK